MMEGLDYENVGGGRMEMLLSSSRQLRNQAEKMRRDKLNMYINELAHAVPIVAMATKRMDKTSVLRHSANYLRIHHNLKKSQSAGKLYPDDDKVKNMIVRLLFENILDGFMMIMTSSGKIIYVSDQVEKLLGHSQVDLMGQSVYSITHQEDREIWRTHLFHPSSQNSADGSMEDEEGSLQDERASSPEVGSSTSSTPSENININGEGSSGAASCSSGETNNATDDVSTSMSFLTAFAATTASNAGCFGERRSFYARLTERSMSRGDPNRYETVHFIGHLRPPRTKDAPSGANKKNKGTVEPSSPTQSDVLFVCVCRLVRERPLTQLSLMEAVRDEYVTRHLPDGRIIYTDHRISYVAGYMSEEVLGSSAFSFIYDEDVPWTVFAQTQMFNNVEGHGSTVYRLRSKTGQLIYLRTRGFLEFNKTTQKVETFLCVNTLLQERDGETGRQEQQERLAPLIALQQAGGASAPLGTSLPPFAHMEVHSTTPSPSLPSSSSIASSPHTATLHQSGSAAPPSEIPMPQPDTLIPSPQQPQPQDVWYQPQDVFNNYGVDGSGVWDLDSIPVANLEPDGVGAGDVVGRARNMERVGNVMERVGSSDVVGRSRIGAVMDMVGNGVDMVGNGVDMQGSVGINGVGSSVDITGQVGSSVDINTGRVGSTVDILDRVGSADVATTRHSNGPTRRGRRSSNRNNGRNAAAMKRSMADLDLIDMSPKRFENSPTNGGTTQQQEMAVPEIAELNGLMNVRNSKVVTTTTRVTREVIVDPEDIKKEHEGWFMSFRGINGGSGGGNNNNNNNSLGNLGGAKWLRDKVGDMAFFHHVVGGGQLDVAPTPNSAVHVDDRFGHRADTG